MAVTPDEMRAARTEAKRLGISLAELLRRSLRTLLSVEASKPWMRYAGMWATIARTVACSACSSHLGLSTCYR
jgi:hypothetical protein